MKPHGIEPVKPGDLQVSADRDARIVELLHEHTGPDAIEQTGSHSRMAKARKGLRWFELTEALTFPTDESLPPYAENPTRVFNKHTDESYEADTITPWMVYAPGAPRNLDTGYFVEPLPFEAGMRLPAFYNFQSDRWEMILPRLTCWVKAQSNWEKAGEGAHDKVSVKFCDADGTNQRGDAFYIYLPDAAGQMPNVAADDVLTAELMDDGTYSCTSDYLDEDFGTIVWWSGSVEDIREGWELCDGSNGTVDLSGRFILCIDEDGLSDENTVGDTGGFRKHGITENNHDDHAPPANHEDVLTHDTLSNHTDVLTHNALSNHASHPDHIHELPGPGAVIDHVGGYSAPGGGEGGVGHTELFDVDDGGGSCAISEHQHDILLGTAAPGTYDTGFVGIQVASPGGGALILSHDAHDAINNHTVDYDHDDISDHDLDLEHTFDGYHTDTDNRPLFYVLAAKQRIDNSHTP